jgi:hypothetical protein
VYQQAIQLVTEPAVNWSAPWHWLTSKKKDLDVNRTMIILHSKLAIWLDGYNWTTRELWLHQLIDITAKVQLNLLVFFKKRESSPIFSIFSFQFFESTSTSFFYHLDPIHSLFLRF